ncbi:hypothetical protein D1007_57694 [Hordeum vulgare]|nr:hypothetical protein D1007_57694 [Hordeum vulgare]
MVVEKLPEVNPPSGRVPGRGLLTLPISEVLRRRNDGDIHDSRKSERVSSRNTKYRPKEGTGEGRAHPGNLLPRPGAWPRQQAASEAPGPPLAIARYSCMFSVAFYCFGQVVDRNSKRERYA